MKELTQLHCPGNSSTLSCNVQLKEKSTELMTINEYF